MIPNFFVFIFGLIIGSFVGMLTFRMSRNLSFSGRSYCDNCKKNLCWFENIPLLSFLFFLGKCNRCKLKISFRYPLIELITGIVFLSAYYLLGLSQSPLLIDIQRNSGFLFIPVISLLITLFISLSVIDLEFKILPDFLVIITGLLVFFTVLVLPSPLLFQHFLYGILTFSFFLAIYLITRKKGMGFGDVKLSLVLGFLLGDLAIPFILLSFILGSLIGIFVLVVGKIRPGQEIPFGPYLLFSALVTLFCGDYLYIKYVNLIKLWF